MAVPYNHREVEKKWQTVWDDEKAFKTSDDFSKPKYYALVEFPYPSGQGLHVGHPRPYTALDIVARKRRMQGYNVLYPMGWDAFGLPAENYAIKMGVHPAKSTEANITNIKNQLHSLGYSFDWDREINTTDPEYYHWTQWIFLKLFKAGLAYKTEMPINWCTSCKVGLANEEVVNGVCERCGSEVIRKVKSQWMLKITEYADKLIQGLDTVDYIERVKVSQKNWIGKSQGAEVDFTLTGKDEKLRIYTTRPDTLFGVTYMVVSPEHPVLDKYKDEIKNWDDIVAYREMAAKKSDFERTELAKDKTGVCIQGLTATNPVNGKEIPVWVSDYVLMTYGTGAIMAVPAHDERDWEFAKKFGMPIIEVVAGSPVSVEEAVYTDVADGTLVNSDFLNGLSVAEAKEKIMNYLEEKGIGNRKTNYKLRDWVFSRQRYWGEPIPIVHCDKCGYVPIDESELPLQLPDVESYMPTDTGESPLAAMTDWVNTTCPCCGGPAKRETDTMPQWAGSSWYYLRYTDPHNDKALASPEALKYWLPVDWYNGGMEHTTLHLLYSRFWHKFLYDQGVVPTPEPYQKRTSHGMILGSNGEKMSKSRGNAIAPQDVIDMLGVEGYRYYFMTDVVPGTDGAISFDRMEQVYNADLANSWGNLISRSLNMSGKYFDGCAPAKPASFDAFDNPLAKIADGLVERYMAKMDVLDYGGAKDEVMELIHAANHYIEDSEPWALAKDEAKADELAFVIYNLLEAIRIAAHLLMPLMPQTSAEALRRLSCEDEAASDDLKGICTWGLLAGGQPVEKGDPLFPRLA